MKICSAITFTLLIICMLFSCKQESESKSKIPGSFHALDMWTYARAYPNKDIPKDAYGKAFEEHKATFLSRPTKHLNNEWEAMGPLNTAGRTLTLAINPQAEETIYAGSASGGLWRSRALGLGQSWEYVETGFPVLGVSTIEFNTQDSMVMYIGTGEVYNNESTGTDGAYRSTRGSYGVGILKSEDGGYTWKKSLDWTYQNQAGVWMVKVAPTNNDVVYAATTEGVYKSIDAGASWNQMNSTVMGTDVEIDPRDENRVVACFGNFSTPGKGIYYTEDGGLTWVQSEYSNFINSFNGKILLARAASDPDILYASVGNGFGFDDGATWLMKSEDNGKIWNVVNDFDYSMWQGWFSHDVAVSPDDPNELITVGIEVHTSKNGGQSLDNPNVGNVTLGLPEITEPDGPSNYVHSDIHFVKYHPTIKDLVLFGTDGGLFLSRDGGQSFRSANGGYQSTQFYNGFSVSHTNQDFALGGLQDNSTSINRGEGLWQRDVGGDGSWTALDQVDNSYVYASSQRLRILRSSNGATSFTRNISPEIENDDEPLFIAPFVLSSDDPSTIYAGGRYIYKTTNQGNSWRTMNNGQKLKGDNRVFAMDVSEQDANIVYVATVPESAPTSIHYTRDGGVRWTEVSNGLPDRVPNDIVLSNNNPSIAFVCYSGFGTNHLFYTRNWGDTWQPYDFNLPDVPGNAIAIDEQEGIIYYGTDIGIYIALYSAAGEFIETPEWSLFGENLPQAAIIMDLKISPSDRKLWAATHGNGIYRAPMPASIVSTSEPNTNTTASLNLYPNPISKTNGSTLTLDTAELDSWTIYNSEGIRVKQGEQKRIDVGGMRVGVYWIHVRANGAESSVSFIVSE